MSEHLGHEHTKKGPEAFGRRDTEEQKTPDWLTLIEPQVQELLTLPEGWDGPYSHTINSDTMATLLTVLARLELTNQQLPHLAPISSGGVQAEWHYEQHIVEVGVEANGQLFAFVVANGKYEVAIKDAPVFDTEIFSQLASHLRDHSQA